MKKNFFSNRRLSLLVIAFVVTVVLSVGFEFSPIVFAQDLSGGGGGLAIPTGDVQISASISQRTFGETLVSIVNYFTGILGLLATVAFIYAGVLWVLSGGSEEMITKSKKIMTYAALGMIVVIFSFSIVTFIAGSVEQIQPGAGGGGGACGDTTCALDETCAFVDNLPTCVELPAVVGGVGESEIPEDAVIGLPSTPVVDENIEVIDEVLEELEDQLDIDEFDDFSEEEQDQVEDALDSAPTIEDAIQNIQDLIDDPNTSEEFAEALETLLKGLDNLQLLREELDKLRDNMPESAKTLEAYDAASDALNELLDDPTSKVKIRRFDRDYKALKDLIRAFPFVQARITATPGEGNVPFTVQLDGLNSIDPTGGTISDYKWTYLDNTGKEISLGSDPVIVTEFDEANTYSVRLRVSTSLTDDLGYKTAGDGVSTVRIKANPPSSEVNFRINGTEAGDIFNVTLSEAQAGLSFDPASTEPALGRAIDTYEWFYGDTFQELRTVPTTVIHTYNSTGEYFVKLEVTDNLGFKDKKITKLFVKSLAADIRITPAAGNVNTEFNFVGEGSRSDDGLITDYEWTIEDDEGRTVVESDEDSFSHRFSRPGEYNITLLVEDITGAKDKLMKALSVASREPIANYSFSIPEKNHPNTVEFNAVDSYDPDEGDIITYSWDFDGDGDFEIVDSEDALVSHTYGKVGEYRATLQVQDGFGKRTQAEKKISINSVLSADIVTDTRATRVGEAITFKAESAKAVAYLWEFGDGETASTEEKSVSHTYNKTGKFTVRMNFFDEDDNDNVDTRIILVGAGEEPLAVINFLAGGREPRIVESLCGESQEGAVVTRADLIRFDAKNSINTDGSSRLLSYDWRFPNGEKSGNKETSFKFDEVNREGECFTVSLVVRDQLTGKLSPKDEVFFKVINELPVITDFVITTVDDADPLVTPAKVKLRIINPKDFDGTIKKYKWWYYLEGFTEDRQGVHNTANPETEMVITSFGQADVLNRYFFVVEIVDNDSGIYSTEERFGEVSYLDVQNGPNLSPVAEFTVDKTTISVGDSITFVSQSYDPQGETLPNDAFRWDFDGDGEFDDTTTGPQVNRQFNTPGEYEVRLRVVHRGLSSSATKKVFVESTNALPQAAFTYDAEGNTVTFDGSHSRFDPDLEDTTLRFEWDFDINDDANGNGIKDDDVQSTEIKPKFTYPEKGLYKVRLKVKDMVGMEGVVVRDIDLNITEAQRQASAYQSLKVSALKNPITTIDIKVVPATLEPGGSADISVRVLNADGSPYTGQVFFELLEGSGEFTPNPVIAEDSQAAAIFSATDKGKVRIRVRATGTIYGDLTEEATLQVR